MTGRAACGANDCAEVSAGATRLFESLPSASCFHMAHALKADAVLQRRHLSCRCEGEKINMKSG